MTLVRILAAALVFTMGLDVLVAQRAPEPQTKGRLFPPTLLGLLEAPDRERWQKPDLIMDALGIADGAVVAEIGAAGGWFTVRLSRRVGPNGQNHRAIGADRSHSRSFAVPSLAVDRGDPANRDLYTFVLFYKSRDMTP